MIELSAEFWCEFAASFGVAVLFIASFFAHRWKESKADEIVSAGEEKDESKSLVDFLREAVRLAEERLKAQDDQARVLEKKAILMGALCVFTVAFLFSQEFSHISVAFWVMVIAVLCLVISSVLCARIVDVHEYGSPGFYAPEQIFQYVQSFKPDYLAYLLRVTLQEHYKSINQNRKVNDRKVRVLTVAKNFWIVGTGAALGALAGNSPAVKWACGWLIG